MGYLAAGRVGVVLMNLLATSRTAHALGAENFGIINFAVSYLAYFLIVVNLGFEAFVTREIAVDRTRLPRLIDSVVTMRLLLAAAMGVLLVASLPLLGLSPMGRAVILVQSVGLVSSAIGLTFVYQGLQQMRVVAAREFGASLVNVLGILWFVHSPDDLLLAACISVGTQLLVNLSILGRYAAEWKMVRVHLPNGNDWRLVRQSMAYFWSLVMITITYNTHVVLLGLMRSETEVGLFTAGWKLFIFAIAVPNLAATLFMPRIANHMDRPDERERLAGLLLRTIVLFCLPIAMLGCALTPAILTTLFGTGYLPASRSVVLLLMNGFVVGLNIGFGTWLTAVGRQLALLRIVTIGACAGVVLNLVLIPLLGGEGAALATLVDETIILGLFLSVGRELLTGSTLVFALRCLTAVIPAGAIAYWIGSRALADLSGFGATIVGGAAGGVVYLAGLCLLRVGLLRFAGELRRLR